MSSLRVAVAVLVGLAGCVAIWIVTPYNNFILRLGYISDSFLPTGALFILILLVLAVNPILKKARAGWEFSRGQLAIILGMLLVASVLPGQGLLRFLPYSLANTCVKVSASKPLAEAYDTPDLRSSLFPDKLGYGESVPASERLLGELLPGETIPWGAWIAPLLTWGMFFLFFALMMLGLSMIVLPQWRKNERLSFPLLEVQNSLIEPPGESRLFASVFRRRSFWIGMALVFVLYLLYGANIYFPEGVPAIPLSWNLGRCFTEEPLCYLPPHIYSARIYFLFVAIAFFMPSKISFSIWATTIAYGFYVMAGTAYFPPFHVGTISDHRSGAMLTLTAVILWLSRARWMQVGRCLVRTPRTDEARRDRKAAVMFAAGIAGMFGWFVWAGVQPAWALLFVAIGFIVCLLITRLVSETGIPFMRIDGCEPSLFMSMVPASCLSTISILFGGVVTIFFHFGSRVNGMTMATHALALDEEKGAARRQPRLALLLVGVLLVGLAVCGAAHLYFNYHHSVSLDGQESSVCSWGLSCLDPTHNLVVSMERGGEMPRPPYNRSGHIIFGATLAGVLRWACMAMPKWPLHPIGILMVYTFFGDVAWSGIFLGWLIKIVLVRYGGSRLYRAAKPFFLGLIIGEVLAAAFWSIVPGILAWMGHSYTAVHIQPR